MRPRFIAFGVRILLFTVAATSGPAAVCFAQGPPPSLKGTTPPTSSSQNGQQATPAQPDQNAPPAAPKVDPAEEAAYKAFFDAGSGTPDTRIQLGNDFLQKYPTSRYTESVYARLVQAYYAKQDWKNFYTDGDKALALYPDDITVLTIIGWVIPHVFNPADPDAIKNLDKAERYEKHAIEVIGAMPKPVSLSEDQFAQCRNCSRQRKPPQVPMRPISTSSAWICKNWTVIPKLRTLSIAVPRSWEVCRIAANKARTPLANRRRNRSSAERRSGHDRGGARRA